MVHMGELECHIVMHAKIHESSVNKLLKLHNNTRMDGFIFVLYEKGKTYMTNGKQALAWRRHY